MESKREKIPLGFIFGLLIIIAVLHLGGTFFHLYWRVTWYNKIVHILGGFLAAFALLFFILPYVGSKKRAIFVWGFVFSLAVGILWELFQLHYGITTWGGPGYASDTTADIICDVAGGLLGSWYFSYRYRVPLSLSVS